MPMHLPDQSHINQVRDALWGRQSKASVMVGAGFSRNAIKTSLHGSEMPTWKDLSQKLCSALYPLSDSTRLEYAVAEASGTSGFLRLAEEYESAFGRASLNSFLQRNVPNLEYIPSELHSRLIGLPWRDIFTTNWDTLLERAQNSNSNQFYSLVQRPAELLHATQPRIVKLHGSLPSTTPFIFTEEDYRSYPRSFAPFVNTVQQAMMETVFLLIGFSGEDPNFLEWTGWIRDNLKESCPKIYLAGWLDLSPHRRRMLERRNVVPIDVAKHPQAEKWPKSKRHQYASDWIITTLENGRSYDISRWPQAKKDNAKNIHEHLHPIDTLDSGSPKKEVRDPPDANSDTEPNAYTKEMIELWKYNRARYPGWIFLPPHKKWHMCETWNWQKWIIQNVEAITIPLALEAIKELLWKDEILLSPMLMSTRTELEKLINRIDSAQKELDGKFSINENWDQINQNISAISRALITSYRFDVDSEKFFYWLKILEDSPHNDTETRHFINHELCLWHIRNFNFESLDATIKDWNTINSDPVWMMRKSAALISLGKVEEATLLIKSCLEIIRSSTHSDQSLSSASRESWVLWLTAALQNNETQELDHWKRWQELTPVECNATLQIEDFTRLLTQSINKKTPLFNLGYKENKKYTFSMEEYRILVDSFKAVRLTEVAGLPPTCQNWRISSSLLRIAAEKLAESEPKLAMRLSLECADSDKDDTFNRIWTRTRIAQQKPEDLTELGRNLRLAISFSINRLYENDNSFWSERLNNFIEGLSRIAIRLPEEQAENILSFALQCYRLDSIANSKIINNSISNLINRSWNALSPNKKKECAKLLLKSPIVGLDNFTSLLPYYIDPVSALESKSIARLESEALEWNEILNIIHRGLLSYGQARKRAIDRYLKCYNSGVLKEIEIETLTTALWSADRLAETGLPDDTDLLDWVFIILPQPTQGMAATAFKQKWLAFFEHSDPKDQSEQLYNIGLALSATESYGSAITLSHQEKNNISRIIQNWNKAEVVKKGFMSDNIISHELIGIKEIYHNLDLPVEIAKNTYKKLERINQESQPCLSALGSIMGSLQSKVNDFAKLLRISISSPDNEKSEDAIAGLYEWLRSSTRRNKNFPPNEIVTEIGVVIASKRGALFQAIEVAEWIFRSGNEQQRTSIIELTAHGLYHLLFDLRYDVQNDDSQDKDVPLLRWSCIKLAHAMDKAGYGAEECVKGWLAASQSDPLPEARYALSSLQS